MFCIAGSRSVGYWEPISSQSNYPSECAQGDYAECRFEADDFVEGYAANMDFANAQELREIAIKEMGRVRLDALDAVRCDGSAIPSCVDLELDIDEASSMAEVKVTYQLPIGFPMSAMLGADSIALETSVREPVELLMYSQ